jgi:DNA-binding beta-propeller fold protein YncE
LAKLLLSMLTSVVCILLLAQGSGQEHQPQVIGLPSSKLLKLPVPGAPRASNSFPAAMALDPGGRYIAILNDGFGTLESRFSQSIAILDLVTNRLKDFPDERFAVEAKQTYFEGITFNPRGDLIYVSVASYTDPTGSAAGHLGNGIAIYRFHDGIVTPDRFLPIPLQRLAADRLPNPALPGLPPHSAIPYPAGIAVVQTNQPAGERILVANNFADNALLLDARDGHVVMSFDLKSSRHVPASYPYAVIATADGTRGYCSLWNDSSVAELDLVHGRVLRRVSLLPPKTAAGSGSHPTAMRFAPGEKQLYVSLANADAVAIVDVASGRMVGRISTRLSGQQYGGSYPNALAINAAGTRLYVANAGSDAIAVVALNGSSHPALLGFVPTEWFPTALLVHENTLIVASGKGRGSGPNQGYLPDGFSPGGKRIHPYVVGLLYGSIARMDLREVEASLSSLTDDVQRTNLMDQQSFSLAFAGNAHPIRHVIYVIKENRTYDQIFGDLQPGDADPDLTMYGESITPNQHALARQFGILDNFYCSGNVSGDGHVWSTAAISSDYTERTWQVMQRGEQRPYDYEGDVDHDYPINEKIPDMDEPSTGYLWTNAARHGLSHRNYAEYIESQWCDGSIEVTDAKENHPLPQGAVCQKSFINPGELLPAGLSEQPGQPSPWPWKIPQLYRNVATKPEILGHFDPAFPDFRIDYPDQLRLNEFLREFRGFVHARQQGRGKGLLPALVIMRLPNDHTAGTSPGKPTPAASIAENDLAVGRLVDAISHSVYWADTAILIVEDDAQDGPDHVDAHRSPVLVISRYSPGSLTQPFVDHNFYTTVGLIHTAEVLLGLPPMNNNDAHAPVIAPLFSGRTTQPPFVANFSNQRNGLIYRQNTKDSPNAAASAAMDFTHADAADSKMLNAILWEESRGKVPMPLRNR